MTVDEAIAHLRECEKALADAHADPAAEDMDPVLDAAQMRVRIAQGLLVRLLIPEYERLRAANAVLGGEWCAENRKAGRGPCGACAWCCSNPTKERWLEIGMQKGWLKPRLIEPDEL